MVGIYKITNTVNGKVYIGQSINIEKRVYTHFANQKCKSYGDSHNPHFHSAIRKYGRDAFSWEVIEECDKSELDDKEKFWITHYDSTNREKGYNVMDGGNGRRNQKRERAVYAIDIETRKIVKKYERISDAMRELGVRSTSAIISRCKHKPGCKSYKGFLWCYADDYFDGIYDGIVLKSNPKPKKINQLDMNGNVIATYPSIKSASIAVSGHHSNISKVLIGDCKTAYGFKWEYAL